MEQRLDGEEEVSLLRQQRSCIKTQSARQSTTQHLSTREPKPSDATSNPISSCLSWCCTLCNADRLDSPEPELVHKLEPELQLEPETKSELRQEPSPEPKPVPVPPPELASGQEPRQHPSSIVNIPCQGLNEEIYSHTCNNKSGSHLSEVKFWLKGILEDLDSTELKHFHWYLMNADELKDGLKPIRKYRLENADRLDTVDLMVDMYTTNTREVTEMILKKINCNKESPLLQDDPDAATVALQTCQDELKCNLKKRFECVFEGIPDEGNPNLLNDIYTELYITEGGTGEVNDEHEVRQIEAVSRRPDRSETTIAHEDIFKPPPGRKGPIRTVMTKGVAGIGKTVLTQKFSLDWAEDKANQDIQLIFPFTFRELNWLQDEKYSLVELVHEFFHETIEICNFEKFQVIFIFDGLDECRLPLDFRKTKILTDPRKSTSVDVLLKNLIMGKLLPSAHVWITTRPAAANQIPSDCIHLVTEVRGFTDPQKEEYFRKRFTDEEQSNRIISHIKTSQSLHIMCHIPVFCWITATVLESMMETREGRELPKSLTEMYIHFLVVQVKRKNVKYHERTESDPLWNLENKEMIESLGKVAFEQLQKGNLIFYESDLTECGIDIREASVYSGVFTQIFKKESRLHKYKVFCFIHLSVQEFLAALHVHLTFNNCGVNPLEEQKNTFRIFKTSEDGHLYHNAVDKALQSSNGHLDLFLRFLLGLSQLANETLLQGLLTPQARCAQTNQETVEYIKKKINKNLSAEKSINLFHCLNELNDRSLVKEIQQSLTSGNLSTEKLSPAQWSALVFILLSSEEDLEVFDLKKYCASEEALLRLLPVVKASKKAILRDCNLSKRSCEALSSILSSQSSGLTELDVSNNNLMDSGVKLLSSGLKSTSCKLESLRLTDCQITEKGCACLVSALKSNPSYLRELDLSYNHPGESGMKLLSAELEDPTTRLETLRVEPAGEIWLISGLKKYFCQLTIDTNTANNKIQLSDDNRKMTRVEEDQLYPDHPDRFDESHQLLCRDGLTGRCYWEVEWRGRVDVSVCYRGIGRKGDHKYCVFGGNKQSWSLKCFDDDAGSCFAWHDDRKAFSSSSVSKRIAVYVDCPAGTLSFYRVSSFKRIHIYTFNTTFTEPLYPGFGFWPGSSVSLCSL